MSKKILEGVVVNSKSLNTLSVLVERRVLHKKYKKIVKRSKKYLVHNENSNFYFGDRVKIIESKPFSKLKRWQILLNDRE